MNIPTKLTVLRIILVPIFLVLVFVDAGAFNLCNNFIALGVFCLASFTDYLDGHLARKWNQVTDLGKLLDSTADKILVGSAVIVQIYTFSKMLATGFLADNEMLANILLVLITACAIIIICREFFISVFRSMAAKKGIIIAADMAGKIKTVVQMVALIILLAVPDIFLLISIYGGAQIISEVIFYIGFAILAVGSILSIISCINYIVKNPTVMR